MINWIKYDPHSREIESHTPHLVTNSEGVWFALHAKSLAESGYEWRQFGGKRIYGVSHWSPINLPGEETTE